MAEQRQVQRSSNETASWLLLSSTRSFKRDCSGVLWSNIYNNQSRVIYFGVRFARLAYLKKKVQDGDMFILEEMMGEGGRDDAFPTPQNTVDPQGSFSAIVPAEVSVGVT